MDNLPQPQLDQLKRLGLDTHAGILKELIRTDPGFFERFFPRRIVRPEGYPDSRAWTQGLFSHFHSPMDSTVLSSHAFTASVLWTRVASRFGFPVIHLAKDLAQAFHLTGIDEHIDISGLQWPFPAFVLVLPLGQGIKTADSGEAQHILAARLDQDSYPGDPFSGVRHTYHRPPNARLVVSTTGSTFPWSGYASIENGIVGQISAECTVEAISANGPDQHLETLQADQTTAAETQNTIQVALKLLALTLIYMEKRGQSGTDLEPKLTRKPSFKKGRLDKEALWSPIFVGADFTFARNSPSDASHQPHASPRVHFRRGHARNQRHGTQLSLSKPIWIAPTIVGG